jgi:hypothetical protein
LHNAAISPIILANIIAITENSTVLHKPCTNCGKACSIILQEFKGIYPLYDRENSPDGGSK